MKVCTIFFYCLLIVCTSVTVSAAPTINGPTGMVRVPTADVLRLNHFALGQYYWQNGGGTVVGTHIWKNIEISGVQRTFALESNHFLINAKINLNQEALLIPAVAIGIDDIDNIERRSIYWALSKGLPYGVRVHMGSGTGRFDGFFFAVEKVLNPQPLRQHSAKFPITSVIVEYDGYKLNFATRMRFGKGVRLDGGWLGREQKMYVGLTLMN